jgi:hypothetical protein
VARTSRLSQSDKCFIYRFYEHWDIPVGTLASMFHIGIVYVYKIVQARRPKCSRCEATCSIPIKRRIEELRFYSDVQARRNFNLNCNCSHARALHPENS